MLVRANNPEKIDHETTVSLTNTGTSLREIGKPMSRSILKGRFNPKTSPSQLHPRPSPSQTPTFSRQRQVPKSTQIPHRQNAHHRGVPPYRDRVSVSVQPDAFCNLSQGRFRATHHNEIGTKGRTITEGSKGKNHGGTRQDHRGFTPIKTPVSPFHQQRRGKCGGYWIQ